ncbi:MAG TPA: lytic murein transglycosylase B [Noviherbaspirillum sp.]|nr:lytic murein transglycosylase B [Noviherbaspirillum sp.]
MNRLSAITVSTAFAAALLAPYTLANQPQRAAAKKPAAPAQGARASEVNFMQWTEVGTFIDHMAGTHGFERRQLEGLFREVRHTERAIQLVMPAPPGRPKNWQAYRARFIDPVRINAGVAFWNTHADALARAEQRYGVPAEIIVAIIGVETVYGRNTGNFRVVDVLTTLGFDYPEKPNREARMRFFRGELENTLLYARESGIDPLTLLGSYAGAIGWPQFMPGSIRRWAVDFDGDGKVDLRNSPVDAIGSVANFLVQHGWKPGEPIVFLTEVLQDDDERPWEMFIGQGLEAKFTLEELKNAGVNPPIDPPADMRYGLVDLQNGLQPTEYWLAANNFFAITKYNRSYFYAMSVVDLARAVRVARAR